jgi:uncharacterized membrane protein (DUF485 family)
MQKSTHEMLESQDFKRLVARKWRISIILLVFLFVIYYGYILLVAWDKAFLAQKIGEATTLGIPLGVAVIVLAWILTAYYVRWANRVYDGEVARLKDLVKK